MKDDKLWQIVENISSGWNKPKKPGFIEWTKTKIRAILDNREAKKRKTTPLNPQEEKKSKKQEIPPSKKSQKRSSNTRFADWFPHGVTINPKEIARWEWRQFIGATVIAWLLVPWAAGIVIFVKNKYAQITKAEEDKKQAVLQKIAAEKARIEWLWKTIKMSEEEQAKQLQDISWNTICLEKEILNYKDDVLPRVTYWSLGWGYFDINEFWPKDTKLAPEEKLTMALQNREIANGWESMGKVRTKLPILELNRLAEKWMDERILGQYQHDVFEEAEKIRDNRKIDIRYRNVLNKAMISVDLIDEHISKIELEYFERAKQFEESKIPQIEEKRARFEKIKAKKERNAEVEKQYEIDKREAKLLGKRAKKGKTEYILQEDKNFFSKYLAMFEEMEKNIRILWDKLIEEDKKNWGIISNAMEEKIRRIRILRWLLDEWHKQIEYLDKYVVFEFPKNYPYTSIEEEEKWAEERKNKTST